MISNIHCIFLIEIISISNKHLQEENNNENSNLTSTQNTGNQSDTNDSLLALAVALRSVSDVSPLQPTNLRQHLTTNRNFTSTTTSSISEKLLSPNLSELDTLTICNRPHRTSDLKGIYWILIFLCLL